MTYEQILRIVVKNNPDNHPDTASRSAEIAKAIHDAMKGA